MKKTLAFTLAETLIVMGIIGVVAALTLPNLNSSTGDKEKVVKVKKIYQNLNDAFGRAEAVYGPIDEWVINDTTSAAKSSRIGERITEFMKLSKNCKTTSSNCFSTQVVKLIDGSTYFNRGIDDMFRDHYRFITADSISIALSNGIIYLDIDGPNKGKNTMGEDIFQFMISAEEGIAPYIGPNDQISYIRYPSMRGLLAAYWIINFENMDYLKIDSSGKCPDGKTILDGTTNITCK